MHKEFLRNYLVKWNLEQITAQTTKSYKKQAVKNSVFDLQKLMFRHMKRSFDIWADAAMEQRRNYQKLRRLMKRRVKHRAQNVFQVWRNVIQFEDYMMKLHAQAI